MLSFINLAMRRNAKALPSVMLSLLFLLVGGCSFLNQVGLPNLEDNAVAPQVAPVEKNVRDPDLVPANPNRLRGFAGLDEEHARRNGVSQKQLDQVRQILTEEPLAIYQGVITDPIDGSRRPLIDVSPYVKTGGKIVNAPPIQIEKTLIFNHKRLGFSDNSSIKGRLKPQHLTGDTCLSYWTGASNNTNSYKQTTRIYADTYVYSSSSHYFNATNKNWAEHMQNVATWVDVPTHSASPPSTNIWLEMGYTVGDDQHTAFWGEALDYAHGSYDPTTRQFFPVPLFGSSWNYETNVVDGGKYRLIIKRGYYFGNRLYAWHMNFVDTYGVERSIIRTPSGANYITSMDAAGHKWSPAAWNNGDLAFLEIHGTQDVRLEAFGPGLDRTTRWSYINAWNSSNRSVWRSSAQYTAHYSPPGCLLIPDIYDVDASSLDGSLSTPDMKTLVGESVLRGEPNIWKY
jgi:hypothetical protein